MKRILSFILRLRSLENKEVDKLYYLSGIKPIGANKKVMDECTVTREV